MKNIFCVLLMTAFFSCNHKAPEGLYIYTNVPKEKTNNGLSGIFEMGKEIGCAMIGTFEFKDGQCFFKVMGADLKAGYDITNNTIYLKHNMFDQAGVGIKIIDDNTLQYNNCIFKKIDFENLKSGKTNSSVNLRSGPGQEFDKLKNLDEGEKVYILDDSNEWLKIRVGWDEGYVKRNFIDMSDKSDRSGKKY